jgi:TRAP-type C4-dicarboxylate transport system substrate-binding protein
MKKVRTVSILLVFVLIASGTVFAGGGKQEGAASQPSEKYVLTFSSTMSQSTDKPGQTDFADMAMDEIEKETNGVVTFSRTYSGTLGGEHDLGVMVTEGSLDIVIVGPGNWADWDPAFLVFDCPFLFDDNDHYKRTLASPEYKAWLEKKGQELGVVFLDTCYQGFKGIINAKRPVRSASDLRGLKIRVPDSPPLIRVGAAMGYTPTPLPPTDQYMGISQGIIDGADHSLYAHCLWKLIEIAKYYTETNHALQNTFIVMNRKKLESLPREYRDKILAVFTKYQDIMNNGVLDQQTGYVTEANAANVQIVPNSAVDVNSFTQALADIIKEYSGADPQLYNLIRNKAGK